MSKYRRISYVGVAAVILAIAVVAAWLLFAQGEPAVRLSAAQVLQRACDTLAESDYDVAKVETTDSDKLVTTFSHSGADVHVFIKQYNPDGSTLLAKLEWVIKDGVWYVRGSAGPDNPDTWSEWEIAQTGLDGQPNPPPCFGAEDSSVQESSNGARGASGASGEEESSDSTERHFVWQTTTEGNTTEKHEFWVDSTGRPVRGLVTVTEASAAPAPSDGANGARGASQPTSSPRVRTRVEETYSGFGEPNVITAPIATPTPAPFISLPNTMLETLFAPVSSGDAVGYFGTGDALKPTTFRTGDASITVQSLKWQDNAVTLELSPYNALAGQTLDFITGDGTTSLSLEASAATGDSAAGTLTWAVESQPWASGDELMLRIREANTPPEFGQDSYTFSVPESASTFTVLGTIEAVDADGDLVTYHVISGNEGGKFEIDLHAGFILVWKKLDYETKSSYELTVEARDPGGRKDTATVTINVTDVAE